MSNLKLAFRERTRRSRALDTFGAGVDYRFGDTGTEIQRAMRHFPNGRNEIGSGLAFEHISTDTGA